MSNFKTGFNQGIQQQYKLGEGQGFKDLFSGENLGKGLAGALPGITTAVGGLAGGLISDGFSTAGGQVLNGLGAAASAIPGIGMILGPALQLASGIVNRGFGTKWDNEGLAKAEAGIDSLNKFTSGATSYDALMGDINRMNQFNKNIKASDLGEDGWFVNRTQNKANELNKDMSNAYSFANRNISNTSDNIASSTLANLERNYAAFGGPLFAYGGQTHGSDFTNGLMFINNGGTHESNPYEGVPISMDQEGNPNLVEEGEVIWNDYVFSDRLKVPKAVRTKYKLRGPKDMTFADAIEKLSKESEERPNDPISLRGLNNTLMKLATEQDNIKQSDKNISNNKFSTGGPLSDWLKTRYIPDHKTWIGLVNGLTTEDLEALGIKKEDLGNAKDGSPGDMYNKVYEYLYKQVRLPFQQRPIRTEEEWAEEMKKFDSLTAEKYLTPKFSPDGLVEIKPIEGSTPGSGGTNNNNNFNASWLRYAPALGSLANIGLAFSQKPDYSNAKAIEAAASAIPTVQGKPLGDFMSYNPFDTEYYANQLRSVSGATRRNIMNTSGGNRAAARAGVLASDNNTMNQMGDLYRKAAEYNLEQKQKVADFNRTTNQYNSDIDFRSQLANVERAKSILGAKTAGAQMREQISSNLGTMRSQALSSLFTNLGNIGIDSANRQDTKALINSDVFGTLNEFMKNSINK